MTQSPYPPIATIRRNYHDPALAPIRAAFECRDFTKDYEAIDAIEMDDQTLGIPPLANLIEEMAVYYAASGNREAAEVALAGVEKAMRFKRWDYFMDGSTQMAIQRAARLVTAVSYTIEFLGNLVTEEMRERWLDKMIDQGIEPSFVALKGMRDPENVEGWGFDPESMHLKRYPEQIKQDFSRWPWLLYPTNLRGAPLNGMLTGAVCVLRYRGRSAETDRWVEMAEHHFGTFGELFFPDGSNDESVSYSGYTALQVLEAAAHLQAIDGKPRFDVVNWEGYIRFLLGMNCAIKDNPSHVINFGDCLAPANNEVVTWIAALYQSPLAQWVGLNITQKQDARALLRYDTAVKPQAPSAVASLWKSDLDWIVGRTGHQIDDLVVAMRSGGPFNHEHADRNSVIVKYAGEVLVVDPHRPPYMWDDPAWVMRTTRGHSGLLIDGQGHQYHDGSMGTNASDAVAKLTSQTGEGPMFTWSSDATPAYSLINEDIESVVRSVAMGTALPFVLIADRVAKKTCASKIQARYFIDNKDGKGSAKVDGGQFIVTRPDVRLLGYTACEESPALQVAREDAGPEMSEAYPFVECEAGNSLNPTLLTVLVPSKGDETLPSVSIERLREQVWLVTITTGKQSIAVEADLSDNTPMFQIR